MTGVQVTSSPLGGGVRLQVDAEGVQVCLDLDTVEALALIGKIAERAGEVVQATERQLQSWVRSG